MTYSYPTQTAKMLFDATVAKAKRRKKLLIAPNGLTYDQAFDEISRIMRLYQDHGLEKGDSIILSIEDDADLVVFYLAAFRYGLTTTTIDIDATPYEASTLFDLVPARAVVTSSHIMERWESHNVLFDTDLKLKVPVGKRGERKKGGMLGGLFGRKSNGGEKAIQYPEIADGLKPLDAPANEPGQTDFAIMAFTSGSTGKPKVVRLTYKAIIAQAEVMQRATGINENSVLLSFFQFTQLGGLASGVLMSFINRSTLCRPVRKFAYQHITLILDSIYRERVTHFYLVPTIMDLLLRYGSNLKEAFDTPDFKSFMCMAAMLPRTLWEDFESVTGKEVINSFGLTEANNLTYTDIRSASRDLDSVGPCVNCEARIIDGDGNGVAAGAEGELIIRSDTLLTDYYGNPTETARVLKDGWFHTGDLARIDTAGNIFIMGRLKDVIISGGYNIYPEEINLHLRKHAAVSEAYTIGHSSETWGEQVMSVVAVTDETVREVDLINHLRETLSELKVPKKIVFVPQLPMNARGKIDRNTILEILDSHVASHANTTGKSVKDTVIALAAETFMIDPTDLKVSSTYGNTPGWDSLGHMMLVDAVKKEFSIDIPPIEVLKIQSIGDVVATIEKQTGAAEPQYEHSF